MPRKVRNPLSLVAAAAIVATALASPTAASAAASGGCKVGSTSQSFAQFGDLGWYFLAPGGSFEGALTWPRSGDAALVSGNEPFYLINRRDRNALRLGVGGSVTTPKLCVSSDLPHLRFVGKATRTGGLDVRIRVYDSAGNVADSSSGSISASEHLVWAPSRFVSLKSDRFSAGKTGTVTVTFTSQGSWLVDDVLIDPYRR